MNKSTLARTGMAGAVAGIGLAVGGVAMASAESDAPEATASSSAHPAGPRGDHGQEAQAKVLAKELDLDETVVSKALAAVRDDLRPDKAESSDGARPTPPTEAERADRETALIAALAKELDVTEAKVKAAFEVAQKEADGDRQERRADARTDLVTTLDDAIKAGTLTDADKASVLKAYDANLIGGGPGGPGGPGDRGPAKAPTPAS